ncbi:MAG: ATP-dependent helicase HrpB [Hyphomicrobiales bacterium]|nr:ATP-dependent helicase HrpB [Hyphomicrobiales bacterium]
MRAFVDELPIDAALPALLAALARGTNAVLVAPPGAGKTTRVPLALMDEAWTSGRKIIVLEPRRLAARAAAARMAATLGQQVGETIGLVVRLESRVSAKTRVLVVTEGVFARMILDDPELSGVAAVLFDEFHERSLDADLGLALALDAQALRDDLRLLAMSATLDGARVAALMGDAPTIESDGRAFPVETIYLGRDPDARIEAQMERAILKAFGEQDGSILAFLPGQGEIERLAERLRERLAGRPVDIAPLYGALDRRDQDRAVLPAPAGRRKIVLATAVAETSLTIEGVRVVVDSGLARVPRYEPDLGLTRLETVRAARAQVDQRRGRAGRTQPGVCYRLWEEAATGALPAFVEPEILSADLSGLVLDLAYWGARDRLALPFLDPPPAPAWGEARALLQNLGALDGDGAITDEGRALRALPLPPRLARMIVDAARLGQGEEAAQIAAILSERGLGGAGVDIAERLDRLVRERSARAEAARGMARRWAALARPQAAQTARGDLTPGALVALAFPDRIARARGRPGEFLMANGRAASLEPHDRLAASPYLAVAEVVGRAAQARILAAAPIEQSEIEQLFGDRIEKRTEIVFDRDRAALRARAARRLGALALEERNLAIEPDEETAAILARGLAALGLERLPWSARSRQLRSRLAFLRAAEGEAWPDVSDAALGESVERWLAPVLTQARNLSDVSETMLADALLSLLPWDMKRRLDAEAPTHFETPAGSSIAVDYEAEGGPAIAVRVQELYGLKDHPTLAGGRVRPTLHLLSPAHRPIQTTGDLPRFWAGAWHDVKKDMKGRYPRHVWPDDPASASPTTRAKPRGT